MISYNIIYLLFDASLWSLAFRAHCPCNDGRIAPQPRHGHVGAVALGAVHVQPLLEMALAVFDVALIQQHVVHMPLVALLDDWDVLWIRKGRT